MSKDERSYFADGSFRPAVMLVDDDELLRRSTARFLTRVGFEVVTAASGFEALEKLDRGVNVDVFVVDFDMPGMNGIELLAKLYERAPKVPRGIWSASRNLDRREPDEFELAWFVKDKSRPIGELVQAIARAVYSSGARSAETSGSGGPRRSSRSGWVRRSDIRDNIEDLNRGSSSR